MTAPAPTLATPRLLGRPPADDRDFAALRLIHADPRATATLALDGRPFGEPVTRWLLAVSRAHFRRHGFGPWFWSERDGGDFVGYCGLGRSRIEGRPVIELFYGLRAVHWRRGYASEAARACLVHGFGALGIEEVFCWTKPDNHGSRGVAEKQGFAFERMARYHGQPAALYRLSRSGWSP